MRCIAVQLKEFLNFEYDPHQCRPYLCFVIVGWGGLCNYCWAVGTTNEWFTNKCCKIVHYWYLFFVEISYFLQYHNLGFEAGGVMNVSILVLYNRAVGAAIPLSPQRCSERRHTPRVFTFLCLISPPDTLEKEYLIGWGC